MKKILIISFFLISFFFNAFSQKITNNSKIYILSCSPGVELYQAFGHTAIWVVDDSSNVNFIYHYGTFNFSDPDFYTNFIKGRLDYMLALESYNSFIHEYSSDGRDVYMFELNMSYEKKQKLFDFLKWKALPENKYYKYDFFMDNCATRVRDVIQNIYGDSLNFAQIEIDKTYRQAITPYLQAIPWTRFGINLLLGMPADKKLDYYSAMFLPDYIDTVITNSVLSTPQGEQKLGFDRKYLIKSDFKIGKKPFFNPVNFFWFLFILLSVISFLELKYQKNFKTIDFLLLLITGLAGVIMLIMWFGTDHVSTKNNLNILWAFPTHLIISFLIFSKKFELFVKKYILIFAFFNVLVFISALSFLPQQFDNAIFPFIIILIGRFFIFNLKSASFFVSGCR